MNHGLRGVGVELVVQGNPPEAVQPSERPFDNPSQGDDIEPFRTFHGSKHDFQLASKPLSDLYFSSDVCIMNNNNRNNGFTVRPVREHFPEKPAAGGRWGSELDLAGSYGYYWSRSLGADNPCSAWYLYFYSDNCRMSSIGRDNGFSVRPVRQN